MRRLPSSTRVRGGRILLGWLYCIFGTPEGKISSTFRSITRKVLNIDKGKVRVMKRYSFSWENYSTPPSFNNSALQGSISFDFGAPALKLFKVRFTLQDPLAPLSMDKCKPHSPAYRQPLSTVFSSVTDF